MRERVKTLLLYASGPTRWPAITRDTVLHGVLGLREDDVLASSRPATRLLTQTLRRRAHYGSLSYMRDWHDAFCASPALDVDTCNATNLLDYASARRKIREYPLVVVLHSVAGDSLSLLRRTQDWFTERRGKLLVFLGNEYDLIPEKIGFLRAVEADYVATQLPLDAARWLYAACDRSQILPAPHALNPEAYRPDPSSTRSVDIGFVGDLYHYFIGDQERTGIVQFFQAEGAALGLSCDIRTKRMPRSQWAEFLNGCKGIIGAESGTHYLERTDQTKNAVQSYLKAHPQASFDEVFQRFFRDYPHPVSGKAISSRHFEPIGTHTCQILLEGRYNDILVADEHYLALKKDFSNIQNVVERFKDESHRTAMVKRTREYVLAEHTYQHRVRSLVDAIFAI
jgi:hypothetical protein